MGAGCRLETTRCTMAPLGRRHAGDLHRLWSSPGVRRFLWDDDVIPLRRTEEALELNGRLFAEHRFGLWGAWWRDDLAGSEQTGECGALVGFAGLWAFRDPPVYELVFGVAEESWGRGLATELSQAALTYAGRTLGLRVLPACTDRANVASQRVLEKAGFVFTAAAMQDDRELVFYEWRMRAGENVASPGDVR